MDEWLTAGDAHFLAKAHRRMEAFVRASNIMVLASHSLPMVQEWCNRGIFLEQGQIVASGDINEVVAAYQRSVQEGAPAG